MPDFLGHLFSGREKILTGVGSPLGFFGLALLIVEAFFIGAGWVFNLPVETRTNMVWAGLAVFVFIVAIVVVLVIWVPQNLVFTEKSHLQFAALYGAKRNPIPVDLINAAALIEPPQKATGQLPSPPSDEPQTQPPDEESTH